VWNAALSASISPDGPGSVSVSHSARVTGVVVSKVGFAPRLGSVVPRLGSVLLRLGAGELLLGSSGFSTGV